MVSVSSGLAHSGNYSLGGRVLNGDQYYYLKVQIPLCGGSGIDVTDRAISAWVYLDAPDVSAYLCIDIAVNQPKCTIARSRQWIKVEGTGSGILSIFGLEISGGGPWDGRVYVDDLEIAP
jgi:hypothetical protein